MLPITDNQVLKKGLEDCGDEPFTLAKFYESSYYNYSNCKKFGYSEENLNKSCSRCIITVNDTNSHWKIK